MAPAADGRSRSRLSAGDDLDPVRSHGIRLTIVVGHESLELEGGGAATACMGALGECFLRCAPERFSAWR